MSYELKTWAFSVKVIFLYIAESYLTKVLTNIKTYKILKPNYMGVS